MFLVAHILQKMALAFINALIHITNIQPKKHAIKWDVLWELIIYNIQNYVLVATLVVQHVKTDIRMDV